MARKVFFSFHYNNDLWKAIQIRNNWIVRNERQASGFAELTHFEQLRQDNDDAVAKWIDEQLQGTTVTVLLIGPYTANQEYIKYQLQRSYARGNGMVGIYVHNMKDKNGIVDKKGSPQPGEIGKDRLNTPVHFNSNYKIYDWIEDDGYRNIAKWIEAAAQDAGK